MPLPPPPEDSEKQERVLKLLARLRCAVCGRPYNPQDSTVVDRQKDAWVVALACRACRSSGYVIVVMQAEPEVASPLELTPEEMDVARQRPAITADEVLDFHFFIESFDGDAETLLQS